MRQPLAQNGVSTPVHTRVAVLFTGYLKHTCERSGGVDGIMKQLNLCRKAFGTCDTFLATWTALEKPRPFHVHGKDLNATSTKAFEHRLPARSSMPCLLKINRLVNFTNYSAFEQAAPTDQEMGTIQPWGMVGENLLNMKGQLRSAAHGLAMMNAHAGISGHVYHAAVRIRADMGISSPQVNEACWLDQNGWRAMARRAQAVAQDVLDEHKANELVTCHRPKGKRMDFCQWSAPPAPLIRTLEAIRGSRLWHVVYNQSCAEYLHSIGFHAVSENILLCAMHQAGVTNSTLVDARGPEAWQQIVRNH